MRGLALVLVVMGARGALGQQAPKDLDPINPDRPDFTNGTAIVPMGKVLLETGYLNTNSRDTRLREFGDHLLLRVPISDRFEWRFDMGGYAIQDVAGVRASGLEDFTPGFKWRFRDARGSQPALALFAGVTLPTGASDIGNPAPQPSLALYADRQLTASTSLGVNVVATYTNDDAGRFTQYVASASYGMQLSPRTNGFLELYSVMPESNGGPNVEVFDAGLGYLLNNDTMVDLHRGVGLNRRRPNSFWGVGVSFRF